MVHIAGKTNFNAESNFYCQKYNFPRWHLDDYELFWSSLRTFRIKLASKPTNRKILFMR